ncbi:VirD4-like conjugal transfer protein, CD1115 family [Bacillus mojavensis]|uniref:VirD4-like conjugal transfer protein, CD1115 family n=1 Tax=Bacillus mojavensis TaxID=72360 RepID=UPI002DBE0EA4|nr:type IV secretory system conjugative DNA transfer family protein [Bacillus mojavensis]MEC1666428.1 type IV secretory system conjugative DNA transfer family protein [Bacillus mojavensis]
MHKEFKQWKKVFADKYFLIAFTLFCYVAVTCIANFFIHLLKQIPIILSSFKSFDQSKLSSPFSSMTWKWFFEFDWSMGIVYVVVYVLASIFILRQVYRFRIAFRDINKQTKGTARWTEIKEIQETYKPVKDDDNEYEGSAGMPIVHFNDHLYVDTNSTHTLVVASTQSGKTETYSYPYLDVIMRAKEKDSVVITDIKGDMLKNTRAEFEKYGYEVMCFNLLNPYWGMAYNPLELVKQAYLKKDYSKAQMLCNTLSYSLFHNDKSHADPMWENASIALVNALILAVCDLCIKNGQPENITMYTLTVMLNELGSNPDEDGYTRLDHFFGNLPPSHPAKLQYGTIQFSQGITRSGIYTGTMAKLKNYTYDTIARMTARNDLNIEDLAYGEKPIALFIVYPDWDDSNYTIISTFLSQVNAVLSEKATLSKESTLPRKVRFLFEEVANIPPIEGLNRSLAVGLSRGMLYTLVIQNVSQLRDVYGDDMATAIMGNLGNQIYIMSDEWEDAEKFSEKLGVTTVISADRQGDLMDVQKSYSEREEERPLMLPDELRRLKKGEWVVLRTKKREDLKRNRVVPYPIFASLDNGTNMLHRYEYLMHRFDNKVALGDLGFRGEHETLDLESLLIEFQFNEPVKEERKSKSGKGKKPKAKKAPDEPVSSDLPLPEEPIGFTEPSEGMDSLFASIPVENIAEHGFYEDPPMNDSSHDDDLEMSEGDAIMNSLEEVYETSTPISDAIKPDLYVYIKVLAQKKLSDSEYAYFESLKTVEELRAFFRAPEKQGIYEQIKKHIE